MHRPGLGRSWVWRRRGAGIQRKRPLGMPRLAVLVVLASVLSLATASSSWAEVKSEPLQVVRRASHSSADLVLVRREVAAASKTPRFVAPGRAFNVKSVRGKSVLIIPSTSTIADCLVGNETVATLARHAGMTAKLYSDAGAPSQWQAGIEQGITEHVSAIVVDCGVSLPLVTPQIAAAEKAGIKVITADNSNLGQKLPFTVTTNVPGNFGSGIAVATEYAISYLNGVPMHALFVNSPGPVQTSAMVGAVDHVESRQCGRSCSMKMTNVEIPEWSTNLSGDVSTALEANRSMNVVIAEYDGMVPTLLSAVEEVNTAEHRHVVVVTYGGDVGIQEEIGRSGSPLIDDVGGGSPWFAYPITDALFRDLSGHPIGLDRSLVNRLIDLTNHSLAAKPSAGFGLSNVRAYERLWIGF